MAQTPLFDGDKELGLKNTHLSSRQVPGTSPQRYLEKNAFWRSQQIVPSREQDAAIRSRHLQLREVLSALMSGLISA